MKLAIVNPSNGVISGGYKKYLQHIVPLISKNPKIERVDVYVPPQVNLCFYGSGICVLSWPKEDHRKGFKWVRKRLKEIIYDIVFIPTARFINIIDIPSVYMVRNMEPLCLPFYTNSFLESVINIGRFWYAKKACRSATRIIAVSKFVKDFLKRKWQIEPNRIEVVYHGINLIDKGIYPIDSTFVNSLKEKRFIFTAGSIRPARGLEDLINAFTLVYDKHPNIKLIIAGDTAPSMREYKVRLNALIERLKISTAVLWAGSLSELEMMRCYRNCEIFVMTSRVEACPNIVLEAMANGCVSISTESQPMPEFFQDAAVYYPPKNSQILAERILEVLSWDDDKRKKMSERAKQKAAQFSWDVCAEKTIEQFQIAIEEFKAKKKK